MDFCGVIVPLEVRYTFSFDRIWFSDRQESTSVILSACILTHTHTDTHLRPFDTGCCLYCQQLIASSYACCIM